MPAIRYEDVHKTPPQKAPMSAGWDASAVRRELENDPEQLMYVHAWTKELNSDKKTDYKLPHHYANGLLVWRGVVAAYAALQGARGGVDIPREDYDAVLDHIKKHYRDFDRVPPDEQKDGVLSGMITKEGSGVVADVSTQKRIVYGYLSVWDIIDADGDYFIQGAWSESIKVWGPQGADRIKYLYMHNVRQPIGKFLTLQEDQVGLYFEAQIAKTRLGDEVLILVSEGILKENSVGFMVQQENPDPERNANRIERAWLWEGSIVTWGAQSAAQVSGVKEQCLKNCSITWKAIRDKVLTQKQTENQQIPDEILKELAELRKILLQ